MNIKMYETPAIFCVRLAIRQVIATSGNANEVIGEYGEPIDMEE